jgi:hypothetical protein
VQGFRSVGPCGAGIPIVGGGVSSDPACASGALALLSAEQTWTATQNFAAITATGATFNTGADRPIIVSEWSGGLYNALSFNGLTTAGMSGLIGGMTADDNLYYMVPTGFGHHFRVNNADVATLDAAKFSVLAITPATSTVTGSIINAGGLGNAGAGYFGGDLVSGGNLQVSGAGTFGSNVSIAGFYEFSGNGWASTSGNYVTVQGLGAGAATIALGNSADAEVYLRGPVRAQSLDGTSNYATIGDVTTFTSVHNTVATFIGPTSGTNWIEVDSQFGAARFGTYTNYPAILDGASNPALYYNTNTSTLTIPVTTSITAATTLLSMTATGGLGAVVINTSAGGGNYGGSLRFNDTGVGGTLTDISSIASGGLWVQFGGTPYFKFWPGLGLSVEGTASGSTGLNGVASQATVTSGVNIYNAMLSLPNVQAASFTLATLRHFAAFQGTIGAGASITAQYGVYVDSSLTAAASNYAFYSGINSGTGRWGFYEAGSAANYMVGGLQLGGTPSDVGAGNLTAVGSARIASTTTIPAGGTAGSGYKFSLTTNFGVFFGSGAPTLSAAKGSIYLRSDGSATNNRAYINTDGGTTWTAVTTAS